MTLAINTCIWGSSLRMRSLNCRTDAREDRSSLRNKTSSLPLLFLMSAAAASARVSSRHDDHPRATLGQINSSLLADTSVASCYDHRLAVHNYAACSDTGLRSQNTTSIRSPAQRVELPKPPTEEEREKEMTATEQLSRKFWSGENFGPADHFFR